MKSILIAIALLMTMSGACQAQAVGGDREGESSLIKEARAASKRKDYVAEAKWLRLAADQGDSQAQAVLAALYVMGSGVPQNNAEAVKLARLSAKQGHPSGQALLGTAYSQGIGVPKDYVRGYMWLNLASVEGKRRAIEERDRIERRMTRAQVELAQKLTVTCQQTGFKDCD